MKNIIQNKKAVTSKVAKVNSNNGEKKMKKYSFSNELTRNTQIAKVYNHLLTLAKNKNMDDFVPRSFDDTIKFDDIIVVLVNETDEELVVALYDKRKYQKCWSYRGGTYANSVGMTALVFFDILRPIRGLDDYSAIGYGELDLAHYNLTRDYDKFMSFKEFVKEHGARILEQK